MKKLLSILGAAGLVAVSGSVVVSCGEAAQKEVKETYYEAIEKTQKEIKKNEKDLAILNIVKPTKENKYKQAANYLDDIEKQIKATEERIEKLEKKVSKTADEHTELSVLKNHTIVEQKISLSKIKDIFNETKEAWESLINKEKELNDKKEKLEKSLKDLGWITGKSGEVNVRDYAERAKKLWLTQEQKEKLLKEDFINSDEFKLKVWNGFFSANDNEKGDFESQGVAKALRIRIENINPNSLDITLQLTKDVYTWTNVKDPYVVKLTKGTMAKDKIQIITVEK